SWRVASRHNSSMPGLLFQPKSVSKVYWRRFLLIDDVGMVYAIWYQAFIFLRLVALRSHSNFSKVVESLTPRTQG
ncbi:MAG: hypothetical protein RMY34_28915, partial [Aulosira sp. DedQUE10]|nr:hypothetical protein [Aulosira sp. DedQUE10]